MWFKFLFLVYTILTILSVYGVGKRILKGDGHLTSINDRDDISPVAFFVTSFIVSTTLLILLWQFYLAVYDFTPLLGWLSTLQIVFMLINWFKEVIIYPSHMVNKTYKPQHIAFSIAMTTFDIWYLVLVIQHLMK